MMTSDEHAPEDGANASATRDREVREEADHDAASGASSDSDSDSDSSPAGDEEPQVEWLVTGRAKRSTAGNRLASLLANEERAAGTGAVAGADDPDMERYFAEEDDDVAFTDEEKDDGSDAPMDSSSSDEDENEAAEDLAGEKELERQAREKQMAQRKRKAEEAIPMKFRKKARIKAPHDEGVEDVGESSAATPTTTDPAAPAPRPKKKSERMSWLPTMTDKPTRASERATTKISKEQLHQQMLERETRRKKQAEIQERKAKKLAALKKPPLTQAERLAEAALVEKRNSKSLNRWEEAEKQREEERLAKLAALNNRKLSGPVVTFWSGIQALDAAEEGGLEHVGKMVSMEEKPRKKREPKNAAAPAAAPAKEQDASTEPSKSTAEVAAPQAASPPTTVLPDDMHNEPSQDASISNDTSAEAPTEAHLSMPPPPLPQLSESSLAGPEGPEPNPGIANQHTVESSGPKVSIDGTLQHDGAQAQGPDTIAVLDTMQVGTTDEQIATATTTPLLPLAVQRTRTEDVTPSASRSPGTPVLEEKFTRSGIILQNFDDEAIKDKHVQTQILFGRKMNKKSSM
jgi:vacuolar protein sorting-associated protein 72